MFAVSSSRLSRMESRERSVAQSLPLQEQMYLAEGGSLGRVSPPALAQQVGDVLGRGSRGPWQAPEVRRVPLQQPQVLHHLGVRQVLVGSLARQLQHLPQRHSVRPDVALRRVLPL